ncbi:MAG: hypothetical protein HY901_17710 [Deltaproteobacteria bacterium]|nr:hypothetical protein [Deltaproteobacteria bacterium]
MPPATLTLVILASLTAAPSRAPVAPKEASFAVQVRSPKAGLLDLRAFLTEAGRYSALLRPVELGRSLGTVLGADLLDPASLAEAGVDANSPMTISFLRDGATVVCLTAAKGGKALERARVTFAGAGQAAKLSYKGAQLEGAAVNNLWRAGVATKGTGLCAASGGPDALRALKSAVDAMAGAGLASTAASQAATTLDAPVMGYLQGGGASGAVEIRGDKSGLKLVGRVVANRALLDKPRDGDLLASFGPAAGPVSVRAMLSKKALSDPGGPVVRALEFLGAQACRGCEEPAKAVLDALRPELTGSVGVVVKGIDVAASAARGPMAPYYLVPHAYLLAVKDQERVRKALEAGLEKLKTQGATIVAVESPEGISQWSVAAGARDVRVGVGRGALFVANEPGARDLAVAALEGAAPSRPEHAVSFVMDGPLATAALRRISVLDVPKSPEVAALFAFGVEAGSLLKAAGKITGFADPDGNATRFEAGFKLAPEMTTQAQP